MRLFNQLQILFAGIAMGLCSAGISHACGLAFLQGSNSISIDGTINTAEWSDASVVTSVTDPCLDQLIDLSAHGAQVDYAPVNNIDRSVTIYTKRDNSNFYIALNISDHTLPQIMGEEIIIHIDPNNSRGTTPQGLVAAPGAGNRQLYDYRFSGTFMRGTGDVYVEDWKRGNGTTWVNESKPGRSNCSSI